MLTRLPTMMSILILAVIFMRPSTGSYLFNGYRVQRPDTTVSPWGNQNNNDYFNVLGNRVADPKANSNFGLAGNSQYNNGNIFDTIGNNNNNNNGEGGAGADSEEEPATTTTTTTTTTASPTYNNNNNNGYGYTNTKCVQRSSHDVRPVPGNCGQFQMCSYSVLITFNCPLYTVFNPDTQTCVSQGSDLDTCTNQNTGAGPFPVAPKLSPLCQLGETYKKAHPSHCARYYDCGRPAMMSRWEEHEWECKYPFLFNENTKRCEHYSMVSCGARQEAYDRCEYKAYSCQGHSHCRPCSVQFPSCKNLRDGINVWQGRVPSPYYVVCDQRRVVFTGSCPAGQMFDGKTGTCADKYY